MNAKERPSCRETIIREGWRPNPQPELWNCKSALTPDGREVSLTPGLRKQMGKMLEEGHWGKVISIRKIKESEEERERRLQALCDSMIILKNARPIPINSGDKLLCVQHTWPWEYEWDWAYGEHVAINKRPFDYVPSWVFEEDNPVSATARMSFAFLCGRGMLNKDERGQKQLWAGVSKKDIGRALAISEAVADHALLELEDLGIIRIERLGLKYKKHKRYCNFYNANRIHLIQDPERWGRIKAAQAECSTAQSNEPRRQRPNLRRLFTRLGVQTDPLAQNRYSSNPPMGESVGNHISSLPSESLDEPDHHEDLRTETNADPVQSTICPEVERQPTASRTPADRILEKTPSLLNCGEDRDKLIRRLNKTGRNERCPCGSGRKFKKCCGGIFNS